MKKQLFANISPEVVGLVLRHLGIGTIEIKRRCFIIKIFILFALAVSIYFFPIIFSFKIAIICMMLTFLLMVVVIKSAGHFRKEIEEIEEYIDKVRETFCFGPDDMVGISEIDLRLKKLATEQILAHEEFEEALNVSYSYFNEQLEAPLMNLARKWENVNEALALCSELGIRYERERLLQQVWVDIRRSGFEPKQI